MNDEYIKVGRVCVSKAGHDKGNLYVIVGLEAASYVYLADGRRRKLASAKKKKIKHIACKDAFLESIAKRLEQKIAVYDYEIAKALNALEFGDCATCKEG